MGTTYVTMGDARGVGPELALRALAHVRDLKRARLVGVREVFRRAALGCGEEETFRRLAPDMLEVAKSPDEVTGAWGSASGWWGAVPESRSERTGPPRERLGSPEEGDPGAIPPALAGKWAGRAIEAAVRELRPERGDVLVTAPLDKAALREGGYPYPGHTEMLASLAGVTESAMLMVAGELRVSLVTGHVPLRRAPVELSGRRLRAVALLTQHALRTGFGVTRPRLAVCGLNPHAGEDDTLGDEESRIVRPAVLDLLAEGLDVTGPIPGDSAFVRALAGEFDAVLALFHDQGMIPVKLHGFGRGVNVTLGLPFVRTSPDHGTALDLAGTGRASPESFEAALTLAHDLASRPEFTRDRARSSGARLPVYKDASGR